MTQLLDRFASVRVLVVGDVMLDEYLLGEAGRLSPEAPVPVLTLRQERCVPGGAANVAANVAALGGRGSLAGAVGRDPWGERLARLLADEARLDTELVRCDDRPTTVKTRVLARAQHLVRIDREACGPLAPAAEASLKAWAEARLEAGVGACVLSDYGKGGLPHGLIQAIVSRAQALGIPTVVDPKGADFTRYRGATVVTPNEAEAAQADGARGPTSPAERAARLREALGGGAVLVTRGGEGLSLFRAEHEPLHLPAREPDAAVDATGAGDTLVAALALALAAGADLPAAARLANEAAGLVVRKLGTSVLHAEELRAHLAGNDARPLPSRGATAAREPHAAARAGRGEGRAP